MGRIAKFLTGLFVMAASQGLGMLQTYASSVEGAAVDYGSLVEFASMAMLGLGGLITGYAVLATIFGIIKHNFRNRRRIREEEQVRRREQAQDQQPQEQQGQPRQDQQQPRQQQGGQQQYRRQRQQQSQGQRRQQSQDRDRQQ
jgi:biopolymer transport protein ExbB/TolQ